MATQTKKNTTAKKSTAKGNLKVTSRTETPLKLTKRQLEYLKIQETAAKAGGELSRAGILGDYKKSW